MDDVEIKLLYVEDDLIDQMALKRMLSQQGLNYQASFATSIAQAEEKLKSEKFDIIITDYNLGDGDAFNIFDLSDDTPIMVATGAGDEEIAVKVIKRGAYDYFVKDTSRKYLTTLPVAVEQAVNRHRSDRQFRLLSNALKSINDLVYITDMEGKILFANQAFLNTHRYQSHEVLGEPVHKFFAEEDLPSDVAHSIDDQSIEGWQGETSFRIQDGREIPVFLSTSVIKNKQNEPQYLINVANDITDRIVEARALHIEKERLATTLSSIDVAVITTDAHGNILLFNKAAETVTGWSQAEAIGIQSSEVYRKVKDEETGDSELQPVAFVLREGESCESSIPTQLIDKLGNIKLVTQNATPLKSDTNETIGAVLTFRDVTLQQKMEEELQKTQKLESLGVLAGGIAHDFNNILTAILGNISMAKMHSSKSAEKTERFLKQAIKAAEQTRALTNQLLTFARGGNPIKENASIVDLVQESSEFVARGSGIRCKYHIDEDIQVVAMDVGQISQVVNNLVINAIQAMKNSGTIRIYIRNTIIADEEAAAKNLQRPGKYVSIAVQDQGTGIPEDILPKIFDPYFTTKDSGNGLGLASCYSIVRKHDGHIEVESTLNIGTTFTILLPAAREQIIEEKAQDERGLIEGDSRVLVMDDESFIRDVAGQMLDYLGFEVAFSANGNEAIQLYRQAMEEGEKFDVVMLDITIPGGMGGKEAIKHLKELDPDVRAIVASGYSKDPVMEKYKEYGFCGRILKPYGIKELNKAFQDLN